MASDVGKSRHNEAPAAAGSTIRDPTVIFLHVGKTGGWTLRQVLYRNVGRSQVMRVKPPRDRPGASSTCSRSRTSRRCRRPIANDRG